MLEQFIQFFIQLFIQLSSNFHPTFILAAVWAPVVARAGEGIFELTAVHPIFHPTFHPTFIQLSSWLQSGRLWLDIAFILVWDLGGLTARNQS
jgi:hypothetical protein